MSDSNNVVSNDAACIAVSNLPPPVKASRRIEQLRAELRALHNEAAELWARIDDARTDLEWLEIDLGDLEIRHVNIEKSIEAMLKASEHHANVMDDLA